MSIWTVTSPASFVVAAGAATYLANSGIIPSTMDDSLAAPQFAVSSSRGTQAAPTISLTGDPLGKFSWWAYSGVVPAWHEHASIKGFATGATANNLGGELRFTVKADNGVLTDRALLDNAGRWIVSFRMEAQTGTVGAAGLQVNGTALATASGIFSSWAASASSPPILEFLKSLSGTIGTHTALTSNAILGQVRFSGSDGVGFFRGAQISGIADGAWSVGDTPTRLEFYVVPDGTASLATAFVIDNALNISAPGLHNNATPPQGTTKSYIGSGTYTPTLFNTTNVAASTSNPCNWIRIGNVVHVTGTVNIDPTAAAQTLLGISLPLTSDLAAATDLAGCATCTTANEAGTMAGDTANNRASLQYLAVDLANKAWRFSFQYVVL